MAFLKGHLVSIKVRKKIGQALKGNKNWLGKKHTEETKRKISQTRILKGVAKEEKNPNWRGGITPLAWKIRNSKQFKEWRASVFTRDNWTCQTCGKKSEGDIESHHIKSFAHFPKLRFEISNGKTLCKDCHKLTDNYLSKNLNAI